MYIVGTSGHIDHGKTSLIIALSGIDCDRLPEEKKREMTIDIGFASIEYPKFGTVSIIDVPGHERFIRNMVVGAWGIDLALLVVAVDDGWMPQTEDHFRILQLLNIERLIVVLNKIDLADSEMIEIVKEEVLEKLENSKFKDSDIIPVSSKTGQGIAELKETILLNLRKLLKITDAKKPYMFIDRIFQSKGHGTVITGTLKNGIFYEDETVYIVPGNKEARIKKIESHFNELTEGNPSQRTALNLSGVSVNELKRGDIIYKENFFSESNEIIARIQLLDQNKKIKNNSGIEILIGTADIKGKIILIDEEQNSMTFFVRLKFDEKWFFYPGEPFILTNPGGFRIIGGGIVLFPQYKNKKHKHTIQNSLHKLKNFTREEIVEFIISVNNWMIMSEIFMMFPENQKSIEKKLGLLSENGLIHIVDDYIFTENFYNSSIEAIYGLISKNIGLNLKEISDNSDIDFEACKILIPYILQKYTVIEKEGRFFTGSSITKDTLSDDKKKILTTVLRNKLEGIELDKLTNEIEKKEISDLIKLGFLINLDGNIVYHKDIYEDVKNKIMNLFNSKDKITVSDAKDAAGLTRKYIIPLLNRIEGDRLIKRLGDFRMKV